MEATKRPHYSNSSIGMYERCPRQYQYRYIEKIIAPPGVALIVGSAVDKSVNADLGAKIQTGALLPNDAVTDNARDAIALSWETEEVKLEPGESKKTAQGESIDKTIRLSLLHHGKLAPTLTPAAVQHPWRIEIPDLDHDLIGYIDVLEDVDGEKIVRDTKTSGKSPAKDDAIRDVQLSIYALAIYVATGKLPAMVTKDYLVDKKCPELVVLEAERTIEDLQATIARVQITDLAIKAGIFPPTSPGNWWCSSKWCGYFQDRCPWGARKQVQI